MKKVGKMFNCFIKYFYVSKKKCYQNIINYRYYIINLEVFISECFQEDKMLPKYWLATHNNVSDAKECQQNHCQSNKKCTAFVYNVNSEVCYLKKPLKRFLGTLQLKDAKGSIFGLRKQYCQGNSFYEHD